MKIKYFFIAFLAFSILESNAQTSNDDVLFTIDGDKVYASEFLRVYNKNLDLVQDESQKNVDEYLKLFTSYKLKLKEAEALGFNKKPSYLREFENYKQQLIKNYITDSEVTDALVEEAYERISYDIKANHILVKVAENANPQDTLKAYNKIIGLRERALNEGFDIVRKEVHNGQTVYGEDLGYFSGFKMVYKFENAAFNTPINSISKPFRTRFGYHIVNVLDKRKSRGELTVAHIMVVKKVGDSLAEKPENRIQDIYKKLKQGEDFEALAKQFSDDKNSAPKGGMLTPFSSGQIRAQEFEDAAFNLKNIEDISKPFQTQYGWHIVKLYNKKLIPPFEDMKLELQEKVKRDSRSKLIDEALFSKLKSQYKIEENKEALDYFASILNEDYYKRTWELPVDVDNVKAFLKIEQKQFSYKDFGEYLIKTKGNTVAKTSIIDLVSKKYEAFLNDKLVEYKEANLENENEEFAHVLGEYRDGLLLFDLMETTIWNSSRTDSTSIQNYYDAHQDKYLFPKRIDAIVASSVKQKTLKKVSKLLKKGLSLDEIKVEVNTNDDIQIIFTSDIMDESHQALPEEFLFQKGISKIYNHNNGYVVVKVNDILPETKKTFEEAKGLVISDYQNYKEETWLKGLSNKFKVVINDEVLNKIKKQIKN